MRYPHPLLVAVIAILGVPALCLAGIANDNSASIANNVSGGTVSGNFTMGAVSNGFLWTCAFTGGNINSATYNGLSMTPMGQFVAGAQGGNVQCFYMVNPPSGTHAVAITQGTAGDGLYACASSYSGVNQATPIDIKDTTQSTNSGSSIAGMLTTSVDKDWLLSFVVTSSSASAGANTHARTCNVYSIGDSDGDQSPAGTYAQNWSWGDNFGAGFMIAAIEPAGSGGGGSTTTLGTTSADMLMFAVASSTIGLIAFGYPLFTGFLGVLVAILLVMLVSFTVLNTVKIVLRSTRR